MSANNYLLITGKKPLGYYEITEMDADTGEVIFTVGNADTLEEVVKKASEYMKEELVEYGIHFSID
jgi:hypothetical protein